MEDHELNEDDLEMVLDFLLQETARIRKVNRDLCLRFPDLLKTNQEEDYDR